MKKPFGWKREPGRHALAAKGIETGRSELKAKKQLGNTIPALPSRHTRSPPEVQNQEKIVDMILAKALEDGGSKSEAVALLESDKWLEVEASKIADQEAEDATQREALKQTIIKAVRKNYCED